MIYEHGCRVDRDTAGTGGVHSITGRVLPDGCRSVTIRGVLRPALKRTGAGKAPNFNTLVPSGSEIGLPGYDIAHLWGPGFGDEAWAGMMYAPRDVNRIWQNNGVEKYLRELRALAGPVAVELKATATAHPPGTWRGHDLLHQVRYDFALRLDTGEVRPVGWAELVVGLPVALPRRPTVEWGGGLLLGG